MHPPGHPDYHVQESEPGITNYLYVYRIIVFPIDEYVIIRGWWLQTHMSTINCTNHIRKPSNLIKVSLNHGLLSIAVRRVDVLMSKGLDSRQYCWRRSASCL